MLVRCFLKRIFTACAVFLLAQGAPATAEAPLSPAQVAEVIGQPVSLEVLPPVVHLGGRGLQQIVVTGKYADGTVRDLTQFCQMRLEHAEALAIEPGGIIKNQSSSTASLVVAAGGKTVKVPVENHLQEKSPPISFRREVIAALNVGACNSGACHGTPSGKAGFRLSLRGFDPAADYLQLTRDMLGRRTDSNDPAQSLILQKALGLVPHEGGRRFLPNSIPAESLRGWLKEGLHDDPADLPALKGIAILPGSRVLHQPARWQQLAVTASFADGSTRDVTRLTVFTSSDPAVAEVSNTGQVSFRSAGEVAILCRYLDILQPVRLTYLEPRPGFQWPNPPVHNYVDAHVFSKLQMLNIPPSGACTDQEFIRRAYLDVCALLPTAAEVKSFLADARPDKRARLIDSLLERPEYADFWTLKWSDVLRNNRKMLQVKGTHVFQDWLRTQIERNRPFNEIVQDLLTANGSTFSNAPASYYRIARDPTNLAETTAQLFFGIRMQCAKCHNHPFERWTQDDYYSLAAFFARVKLKADPSQPKVKPEDPGAEIVFSDRSGETVQPRTGKTMPPRFLGGVVPELKPGEDRRTALAVWLTSADNSFFAKSVVNRIWYHLNGKGIVDPVDDFRDSNPSANDELLDALAKDFVAHHFDVKHVIRTIMTSQTYQLSAQTNDLNKDDAKYFSHAGTKLLTAEQLLDALSSVTEVPEKFDGMPAGTHAVQLPDGDGNHPFLKTFGQPARELACECEREGDSNLAQALQLINGPTVNDKLRNPKNVLGRLLEKKVDGKELLGELYLAGVSRYPTPDESQVALDFVAKAKDKRKAWEDVLWALVNSKEFLFRH